jgi:hypothetical protein
MSIVYCLLSAVMYTCMLTATKRIREGNGGGGKIITETRQDGNKWDTILIEWGEGGGGRADMNSRYTLGGSGAGWCSAWLVLGGVGGESLGGAF